MQAVADGKQPYAIARSDAAPLAFAGLWEGWRGPDGEVVRSFAILTTTANASMRTLHERMPVILEPANWAPWLEDATRARELMTPAAEGRLRIWPVGRAVNNVRNGGAALLDPA